MTILGTGYLGLVTGADFACRGIQVTCVDIDVARIEGLQQGRMPFFEPGLPERVHEATGKGMLFFSSHAPEAIAQADVVLCAVGTPADADGRADLRAVWAVADAFAHHAKDGAVLVNKSTVPVGTAAACTARIAGVVPERRFAVVSNPEFLSQGTAVHDTAHPYRIVVGVKEEWARAQLRAVHADFIADGVPYLELAVESAEAVKCAANAFLATKVSFMNEVANYCERVGADSVDVARAVGLDPRIGPHFLRAGIGYGGGCLSKDVRALIAAGEAVGAPFQILPTVENVNDAQWERLYEKLVHALDGVAGKTIAVWGLSFKPGTDDMRNAPSVPFVRRLCQEGAGVTVYDPVAMDRARMIMTDVTFAQSPEGAAEEADAIVLLTEWDECRHVDFTQISGAKRVVVLADGRGVWRGRALPEGWKYVAIGAPDT